MHRLGVVGLVTLDRVDGGLPRLGGAPLYAARALRLLGHPAVVATKVADEDRHRLSALRFPVTARAAERTIAFRIENRGERRLMAIEELGDPWTPEDVRGWLAAALTGCTWVHAGALTRGDFPAETLAALRRGRRLSLDGQALVRPHRVGEIEFDAEFDREVLRHVDVLKLSDEEAEELELSPTDRSLGGLGVPEIVLTLGQRGSIVYADGLAEHVPAHPLDAVDPTGAGDVFMAAYASFRLRRHSPPSAARLATGTTSLLMAQWRGR
jgi:sugar/nucleoside kinase (ribokinase family)